jgi:hypothetical protein
LGLPNFTSCVTPQGYVLSWSAHLQTSCVATPGALRPERRPLVSVNVPQVMGLLNIALGVPKAKEALPLREELESIADHVTTLFAQMPSVLANSVSTIAKVLVTS